MSKEQDALKLALEALEVATTPLAKDRQEVLRAQAAIREALAEQPAHGAAVNMSSERVEKQAQKVHEQPAHHAVDWEKLYLLEVKKKNALVAKYERDTGKKLTRIVPMTKVTRETIAAAHEVTMRHKIVLGHELLTEIYQAMDAKREFVGLTDEEIGGFKSGYQSGRIGSFVGLLTAIEAKLREKNA